MSSISILRLIWAAIKGALGGAFLGVLLSAGVALLAVVVFIIWKVIIPDCILFPLMGVLISLCAALCMIGSVQDSIANSPKRKLSNWKCLLGFHALSNCRCLRCGVEIHKFDHWLRCTCGQVKEHEHQWVLKGSCRNLLDESCEKYECHLCHQQIVTEHNWVKESETRVGYDFLAAEHFVCQRCGERKTNQHWQCR